MKPNHVWIIEMLCTCPMKHDKWEPTAECAFTKEYAEKVLIKQWYVRCPNDKFRIRKYTSENR